MSESNPLRLDKMRTLHILAYGETDAINVSAKEAERIARIAAQRAAHAIVSTVREEEEKLLVEKIRQAKANKE